ncbi:hypothetical protein KWY15_17240 [Clostridioides difficile]|uniref:Uncharacterized protein n=3 Tax=Leicestervirus CD382 TaxID=2843973 RepID=A0A1J1J9R5_9CAUD|nr:hypothetical protein [Clostridioides difficile]YP_004508429.1 hypothetical protein phiCD38-2_gp51 [Clostridium phage phiCD38-2]ALY06992.1 hypothetical protein CDHS1_49 [Clostridium phage CDSH1]WFG79348.1 hypothetical protein JPGLOODI_00031 [Clostridioides phage AR1075-1]CUL03829.1 hypothetical protein [Clostridium phage slur17]AEF56926.1 hypothetical protein phiCD38-2_gp51 [Clostridium phage phiCD38-2]EII6835372.1 hypothetical protein [Clostridioides difficile]
MKKDIKYNVIYFNSRTLRMDKESFSTLIDARVCKNEKIKEYENVEIIKKTIIEKLMV